MQQLALSSPASSMLLAPCQLFNSSSASTSRAFVSCEDGGLVCLDLQQLASKWHCKLETACKGLTLVNLPAPYIPRHVESSSASVKTNMAEPAMKRARLAACDSEKQLSSGWALVACTASGAAHILCPESSRDMFEPCRLPGAVMSQLLAFGGLVLVGCRDDCLYLLDVG